MQQFRRFTQGPVGIFFLVLCSLPFVVAGFYGYFSGGAGADQIAKVGDTVITKNLLSNEIQSTRQQIKQSNPEIDSATISQFVNPTIVLDGLINNTLLEQAAVDARIVTPQEQVLREIVQVSLFQDADGKFSREIFNAYVARLGYSPNGFIQYLQTRAARDQLENAYTLTGFATVNEFDTQVALSNQTRDVSFVKVELSSLKEKIDADADGVKEWYEQNKSAYVRPAQVRLSWVEIDPENYNVEPTQAQLEQAFEAKKAALEKAALDSQMRQVSDIFIAVDDQRSADEAKALAEQLAADISAGTDFATVATEHSDDPVSAKKGGQLGWLTRDALPDDMSQPIFALKAGEVSAPVKTADGYHLFKVEKINVGNQATDDESIRKQVASEYADQEKLRQISADSNLLADLAYEHSDLTEAANELGLTIHTTEWFDPLNPVGLAENPVVAEVLTDDEVMIEGENSSLLNLGDNHFVVVRLDDKRKEAQLAFSEVKDTVANDYAIELASRKAAALKDAVSDEASMDDVAKAWETGIETAAALRRNDTRLDEDIVAQVFELPPQASDRPVLLTDSAGNLIAVQITAIGQDDPIPEEFKHFALSQLAVSYGKRDFQSYIGWLRTQAKINISEDKLNSL